VGRKLSTSRPGTAAEGGVGGETSASSGATFVAKMRVCMVSSDFRCLPSMDWNPCHEIINATKMKDTMNLFCAIFGRLKTKVIIKKQC